MRTMVIVVAALIVSACAQSDFYRARGTATGQATAQAFRVRDGAETPVSDKYVLNGTGSVTVQSAKPYLTLDGAWSKSVEPGAPPAAVEPGAVLLRPAFPAGPLPKGPPPPDPCAGPQMAPAPCYDSACLPPSAAANPCAANPPAVSAQANPCANPPAVSAAPSRCGQPVYRGCDGTEGGNRPQPVRHEDPPPPGTGWPCENNSPGIASPGEVVGVAIAIPVHVVECLVGFARCLFTIP